MLQEIAQTISFLFLVVFLLACTYINTGFCVGIKKNCLQRLNDNTPCRAFNWKYCWTVLKNHFCATAYKWCGQIYNFPMSNFLYIKKIMKQRSTETQTLRAGCSKAEPKFSPAADPLPGGAGRPKFNQLVMVTTFTYIQTQFGGDRCTQFRVIMVTGPPT